MTVLLGEILHFSRIGRPGKTEPVDLNQLVKETLEEIKLLAGPLHANIMVDKLPVMNCNAPEMKVVFLHLLTNALLFSKKEAPPEIFLTYKNKSTAHEFFISDNGIGIAEKYFKKIFRMFQRLNSEDDYPGNGAGLAFCKKIIEAHNGQIGVSSKLGEGFVFNFTIPVNQSI
jgi:light-regulated signal transduction histidine kinase (bacteriophytochrome)